MVIMEEILKLILTGLIGGIVAFFALLKYFFSSYASEKGRNLATKQDIAEITKEVEEVKHQYNLILEQFKSRNQLALAALDKRIEVHQKAYSLWRELSSSIINQRRTDEIILKCEDWWWENCLYLDAESREAFWSAFRQAPDKYRDLPGEERKVIRDILTKARLSLEKGIELPPIKDIKLDDFEIKKEDKG